MFRSFINTIRRFKLSSAINILGLATVFSVVFVLSVQTIWELTYNHGIKNSDQIYRVEFPDVSMTEVTGKYTINGNGPQVAQMVKDVPGIEDGALCGNFKYNKIEYFKDETRPEEVISGKIIDVTPNAVEMFGIEMRSGSTDDFKKPNAVIVSESFAKKFSLNPGNTIELKRRKLRYDIVGVFEDLPDNCLLGGKEIFHLVDEETAWGGNPASYNNIYYIKLEKGINPKEVQTKAREAAKGVMLPYFDSMKEDILESIGSSEEFDRERDLFVAASEVRLTNIRECWLKGDLSGGSHGDKKTIASIMLISFLLLIVAAANTVNFFFALVPQRVKSVNIRKILGCNDVKVRLSFIAETGLIILISLLFSAIIIWLFAISPLTEILTIPFASNITWKSIAIIIIAAAFILLTAGIYPARYISSFQPAITLKGSFGGSRAGKSLRNVLVAFQFFISLMLIILSTEIQRQHNYMMNFDMGYNPDDLLVLNYTVGEKEAFENEVRNNSMFEEVSWASSETLINRYSRFGSIKDGQPITFYAHEVAANFLKMLDIKVIEGRDFVPTDTWDKNNPPVILNKIAKGKYNLEIGQFVEIQGKQCEIIGFYDNIHFFSLDKSVEPHAFYIAPEGWASIPWVKLAPEVDLAKAKQFLNNLYVTLHPHYGLPEIGVYTDREERESIYYDSSKTAKLLSLASYIAIIISLMGVFGLVMYDMQYRKKEIAIRKVHGASVLQILKRAYSRYLWIVLGSFAVAAPIAYIIVRRYLSGFAYHIGISPVTFITAVLLVVLITIGVISASAYEAASSNPIDSIKSE